MDFKWFAFVILLIARVSSEDEEKAEQDSTLVLTDENFQETIKTNNFFVMFFAPWCGHCTKLKPTWAELAELLNTQDESRVKIAKVDCTENHKTCSDNEVTSYPTLKFFKLGNDEAVKYRSTRDLPSLTQFINDQLGSSLEVEEVEEDSPAVPSPLKALVELTDKNFNELTGTGNWFVKFYAPWCGHCQRLAPIWNDLATALEHDDTVNIGKIDCTEYRPTCKEFEVKGFPTLLWLEDGKKIDKYSGPRAVEDFKEYINERLNTKKDTEPAEKTGEQTGEEGEGAALLQLTGENFQQGIQKGVVFVKFFAPWCGHCKRLLPTWQSLAEKFVGVENVRIAKVDCTLTESRELCNEQEVNGFPTLFIYKDGQKLSEYEGPRDLNDLYDFVKTHISEKHDEL